MKIIKITLEDLFNLPSSIIYNPDSYRAVRHVSIDSRDIKKNTLFFAIKGEKFDGHNFIKEAIKKGASTVVINKNQVKKFSTLDIPVVAVEDTTIALGDLAKTWRNKLDAKVIGITGSNGKTSTKEMIAALLQEKYKIEKTVYNNNNHIGVPLTIFSADGKCEALVLEQGTNHFGEIEYTAKISQPDFALITNIGESHIEFLKNRKGVYKEKAALFDAAEAHGGLIFVNTDDPILKKETKKYSNRITFGFKGSPDIKGKIEGYTKDGRTRISVSSKKMSLKVELPVYGLSGAKNFLASCAVVIYAGLNKKEILSGAAKLKPANKRMQVKTFASSILIDDTYNASPDSMKSAFETVRRITFYGKKILVLGDMFELGKDSNRMHAELAGFIPDSINYTVLTYGKFMRSLADKLKNGKRFVKHFSNKEKLDAYINEMDFDKAVILVKGSRGMKMEEFVKKIEDRL